MLLAVVRLGHQSKWSKVTRCANGISSLMRTVAADV
jgi:hypothetical protein